MSTWQQALLLPRFIQWSGRDIEFIRMSDVDPQIESAIERVKAGSIDDYEDVVRAYHLRLRNFLAASCPPGADSDEIAHRAFLEAFKQIQSYRLGTNFYGWVCTIARNLLLAELKRYQRLQKNNNSYLEHVLTQGLAEAIESESADTEAHESKMATLRACQQQLSPESQQLIQARYSDQTPLDQVAQKIGKSISAVKFQLFAIRKKLLKCVRGKMFADNLEKE